MNGRNAVITHNLTVKIQRNVGQWKPLIDLPNTAGYTFLAALKDGTVERKQAVKTSAGTYNVPGYNDILAWAYAQ